MLHWWNIRLRIDRGRLLLRAQDLVDAGPPNPEPSGDGGGVEFLLVAQPLDLDHVDARLVSFVHSVLLGLLNAFELTFAAQIGLVVTSVSKVPICSL